MARTKWRRLQGKILVLEDDVELRETLSETLEDYGLEVCQAGDSAKALDHVARRGLDLILTDVRMAGPDGLETLAAARALKPDLKSIVMTGYADDSAPPRAVQVQASDYLYKPFTLQELVAAVQRVLGAQQEAERYRGLLGIVVSGYKALVAAAADAQFKAIEKDRDEAFRAFYVFVRAGRSPEAEVLEVWSHILRLEVERDKLEGAGLERSSLPRLAEGYRSVTRGLGALTRASAPRAPALPLQRMRHVAMLQAITRGRLSLEQLKLMPLLTRFRHEALREAPELQDLYQALWGPS